MEKELACFIYSLAHSTISISGPYFKVRKCLVLIAGYVPESVGNVKIAYAHWALGICEDLFPDTEFCG